MPTMKKGGENALYFKKYVRKVEQPKTNYSKVFKVTITRVRQIYTQNHLLEGKRTVF